MLHLNQKNTLVVAEIGEHTIYVDAEEHGLVPLHQADDRIELGDEIGAYLYRDASNTIVATLAKAYAQIGECAYLRVCETGERGTFLDWGLPKDLILPLSEQVSRVRQDRSYVVCITEDQQGRPMASMKLHHYLSEDKGELEVGQAVDLLIAAETDLGFKAVVNHKQLGLIFHGELSRPLKVGKKMKGWVVSFSEEGRINLSISAFDSEARNELDEQILQRIDDAEGRLYLSDKSDPSEIFEVFGVSKANFKRSLSRLYKQRKIKITKEYIELP